ncbi:hypothetical protein SDC9_162758 [bioreactor metagenome]|uniref:BclA C-terminal domain-containing protein n=1 Tax=bioreactor metagenome TaxID=1076179 RepID=A0A645FLZ5_9ZZZZ
MTWWIATDGAEPSTFVRFDLQVNGGGVIPSVSPIVTGQLNGSALITISSIPSTVRLINNTGATVMYGNTPIQANIVITEVAL